MVNLNVGVQGEELIRCLNESGAKVVVTMDPFAPNIYSVIKNTRLKTVILHSVMGVEKKMRFEQGVPQPQIFQDVTRRSRNTQEPAVQVSPGDVAVLQYTSGSTGVPKAATLTHSNLVASVLQSAAWMGMSARECRGHVCHPFLPRFWDVGLSPALVFKGYRMVLLPRIDLMDMLSLMETLKTCSLFPSRRCRVCGRPSYPSSRGCQESPFIRSVATSGGAPLPHWAHERFEESHRKKDDGGLRPSEASSATHFTPYPRGGPMGSIGVPLPDTEAKIMDSETGER